MGIVAVAVIMNIFLSWMSATKIQDESKIIFREYLLKMESEGYLSTESKQAMEAELAELNIYITDWGDTTFTEVGYGQKITLSAKGYCETDIFLVESWNSFSNEAGQLEVNFRQSSTAKN